MNPSAPRTSRERRATFAFIGGVGLLLTLAVIVAFLAHLSVHHEDRAMRGHAARNAVDNLYMVLIDAEAGQRGFLIAGELTFLEPYHRGLERLSNAVAEVEARLDSAGIEAGRIAELKSLVERERHLLAHPLELAGTEGLEAGRAFVATGQGRQNMDRIRKQLEDLRDDLKLTVAVNTAASSRDQEILLAAVSVFLLAAIILSTLEFATFRAEIRGRRRTEAELRQASASSTLAAAMADALQAAGDRHESYAVIERYGSAMLPDHPGALYVYSNSRDHLAKAARWRQPAGDTSLASQFSQDECWALRRGKPHRTGPGLPDPVCAHVRDPERFSLCLPISARGETSSVLHISLDATTADATLSRVASAAANFADQLALGLANIALQERLRAQAIRDPLTGLHNRRFLDEVLPREIQRARRESRPLGLLMLDIDHFKRFNDSHGHDAGDAVLRAVAREIESSLRESDLVCRYGGEEIVVLLPDSDTEASLRIAEKIRNAIRTRDVSGIAAGAQGVTASIGVAAFPDHATSGDALIRIADNALYAAKRTGRDRVVAAGALPTVVPPGTGPDIHVDAEPIRA